MPGILEDTIMILLNIKNLRFKIFEGESHKVTLKFKGEGEVTGKDFDCPSQLKLVNPELHIATITDKKIDFEMELTVEKGIGYVPRDQVKKGKAEIGAMAVDAIYTPIKNVNFQVESMRVGDRTDFDKLSLEIETDGTITPEEAFFEACDLLIKHFNIIFQGKAGDESSSAKAPEDKEKEEEEEEQRKRNEKAEIDAMFIGGRSRKRSTQKRSTQKRSTQKRSTQKRSTQKRSTR
jgi:DNA-directed RNA polymerase subunit alpha